MLHVIATMCVSLWASLVVRAKLFQYYIEVIFLILALLQPNPTSLLFLSTPDKNPG